MTTEPKVFLHIGAPKTASTFLQKEIFCCWPNMEYRNELWLSYLVLMRKGKKYLISNETLMGRPWNREPGSEFSWRGERIQIIEGLSRLFPRAQVLVCFRKQADFVLSLYKQYLHEGGTVLLEDFFDIERDSGIIERQDIKYMEIVEQIERCFEKRPFVFTLAELIGDFPRLMEKFEKLFGEKRPDRRISAGPVNVGVRYWQGKLLRILNIIDKKPGTAFKPFGLIRLTNAHTSRYRLDPRAVCQDRLKSLSKKPIQFKEGVKEKIGEFYHEDWCSLCAYVACQCSL